MRSIGPSILLALCLAVAATTVSGQEQCGRHVGNKECPGTFCCSYWGYCGRTAIYCDPDHGCQSKCWESSKAKSKARLGLSSSSADQAQAENVYAGWALYDAKRIDYDLNAAHVFCARKDANKPYSWRSKYGWTGFCGPTGPRGEQACGKCLKVTNRKTGAEVTARIVDNCGNGGLNLDYDLFNELDTDETGNHVGHLRVDYVFVDCEDEDEFIPFNRSNAAFSVVNRA